MKRPSSFPDGFGADSAMMTSGAVRSPSPAEAVVGAPDAGRPASVEPPSVSPMAPANQLGGDVSVQLDPGGFHLDPDRSEIALQEEAEKAVSSRGSIVVPLAVVAVCLAVAAYFFDFPF